MRTDELIAALAAGAGPAPRAVVARRLTPAVLVGVGASIALAFMTLGLVPDVGAIGAALWIKLGYALVLAAAAAWLTSKLARPAARARAATLGVIAVPVVMLLAGTAALLDTPSDDRTAVLLGASWVRCPLSVFALSLPALAANLWAVRGVAPTRPRAAGFAAGLLAGAIGAFGYAFACFEQSTTFIALWYTLGIGMVGALGSAMGLRALRW